ncbi:MAG: HYR domain-containing protein, partial [Verrucomicrobiota bacterium]
CTQIITVVDTTPPAIVCASNIAVECDSSIAPSNTGMTTATDLCDTNVTLSFMDQSTGQCPIVLSRTWTATDDCGNAANCTQTVFLVDTTMPVMSCPSNIMLECGLSTAPSNTGSATALDACDTNVVISSSDVTNGVCPIVITRTWSGVDICGNTGTCTQTITLIDTTSPSITCPTNLTAINDLGQTGAVVNFVVPATDLCGPPNVVSMPPSGSFFPIGTTTVSSTATDACGNSTNCTFDITVFRPADLAISKTSDVDPVFIGQLLTYTITVTNEGIRNATNLVVTDTLSPFETFTNSMPGPPQCIETNGIVTCTIPGLAPGASTSITLTVDFMVPPGEQSVVLTNQVTVQSEGIEQNPTNNTAVKLTTAFGLVELSLLDDPMGLGTIGGATSGLYLVNSMFDLTPIALHPKFGFDHWEVDGMNVGSTNPLHITLSQATTVQVFFTSLFIDVTSDVTTELLNWNLDFGSGIMYSDLRICNASTTDLHLIEPFWYAYPSNANQFLINPDGETNGMPYIDITDKVTNALPGVGNMDLSLDTNECVVITNIAWYQVQALPFTGTLFALFADPPGDGGSDVRDTDRDGIPNHWEIKYGLNANHNFDGSADPDGDGADNFNEFLADTDPGEFTSVLKMLEVRRLGGSTYLRWSGGTSVTQYLECATSPNGPWTVISTNPPPTEVIETIYDDTIPNGSRFYRIRVYHRTE